MPTEEQLRKTVEDLLAELVTENKLKNMLQMAVETEYWRTLFPGLKVMELGSVDHLESVALSRVQEISALAHLKKHGYFQLPSIIAPAVIGRMSASIEALHTAGWPAVFSYVYDEFWAVLRTPSIVRLLSRKLGAGYLQTAGVWTYHVDPRNQGSGWWPHVDSRNNTERLTIWIPLTDAHVGNGCMYVIPQDCMPCGLSGCYLEWTSVSRQELEILLHSATPLPAACGSLLGWNNSVIHWGGRALEFTASPRVSIAAEFLSEGTIPGSGETPVFDAMLPDFADRLRVIGQAILAYDKFEPLMRKYRDLATKLLRNPLLCDETSRCS